MRKLWLTGALVLLGAVAVATPAPAQTTSNGPYYATPSWDQQLACTTSANCPRFIVLSNWVDANFPTGGAAVLDRETGLVWERSPDTTRFPWNFASIVCASKKVGGRVGWRLAVIQEIASLMDPTVPSPGPTLPAGHPFQNVQSNSYWAATSLSATAAWWANFTNSTPQFGDKTANNYYWCVRGGPGLDVQ